MLSFKDDRLVARLFSVLMILATSGLLAVLSAIMLYAMSVISDHNYDIMSTFGLFPMAVAALVAFAYMVITVIFISFSLFK